MDSWKPQSNQFQQYEQDALIKVAEAISKIKINITFEYIQSYTALGSELDALVTIKCQGHEERYACEIKGRNTPQAIELAVVHARKGAMTHRLKPLIIVPYITEERMQDLLAQGVSSLDMCGNICLKSKHFFVWRTGQPNQFRQPAPHLNPFRGDNSIFSRCFMLRRRFESLVELQRFAQSRLYPPLRHSEAQALRLGTASKTVQALQEQLIIQKVAGELKLMDHGRLLRELGKQYQAPANTKLVGKIPMTQEEAWVKLNQSGLRVVATGLHSATRYGVLSPSDRLSVYVDDLRQATQLLDLREQKAFANCELIETKKNFPFFDLKWDKGVPWASPIQTWLELSHGNSREQEAAQSLVEQLAIGRVEDLA
jgi:hypothetical protein